MALLGALDEARLVFSFLKVEIRIYDDNTSFSRVISVKLRQHSSLHGVLAELGVVVFLLSSGGFSVTLVSGEGSSGGTGSSNSEVVRGVSGLGESVSSGGASHLTEDGEDLGEHVLGHRGRAATAVVDLLLLLPRHHAQDGGLGDAARGAGAPRAEDGLQLSRGVQVVRDGDEVGLPRRGVGIVAGVEAQEGVDYDLALRPATVMGHRSGLPRGGPGYMRVRLHGR